MELSGMNKVALRDACKAARISYGGMNNDAMRDALQAHYDTLAEATLGTPAVDIALLGLYGLGGNEDEARCPHCGVNHMGNGYQTAESLTGDGVKHKLKAEYICLACNGEWGPAVQDTAKPTAKAVKGTGLKIQTDRIERNGIKQPSTGGACRSVWDACSEMQALDPATPLKVKQVKAHAATMGWNENNAVIEFYRWKKWSAPTVEEMLAPATDPDKAMVDYAASVGVVMTLEEAALHRAGYRKDAEEEAAQGEPVTA